MSVASTTTRSPIGAFWQRCREWFTAGAMAELQYCDQGEIERMAHEAGVTAGEFGDLVNKGPHSADQLLERMAALDLDPKEVAQVEPAVFHDLQRVCSVCGAHRRCNRDLHRDAADPAWKEYCPNVETLKGLDALPWASRRES